MEDFPIFLCSTSSCVLSVSTSGSLSDRICPSRRFTIRVAYSRASSGLWVTITTSRSLATSFSSSITWILVLLSRAPVGLVRQHDIRVIHQRPGNGHPLHLAAGHLIGLFVQLISQPHLG